MDRATRASIRATSNSSPGVALGRYRISSPRLSGTRLVWLIGVGSVYPFKRIVTRLLPTRSLGHPGRV